MGWSSCGLELAGGALNHLATSEATIDGREWRLQQRPPRDRVMTRSGVRDKMHGVVRHGRNMFWVLTLLLHKWLI